MSLYIFEILSHHLSFFEFYFSASTIIHMLDRLFLGQQSKEKGATHTHTHKMGE
jgi:hypothetical protein